MTFGERVKAARQHASMTQEQLAERVRQLAGNEKFKQQSLQKIEAGGLQSSGYVALIAAATGTDGVWLTTGKGNMVKALAANGNLNESAASYALEGLKPEQLELLRTIMVRFERSCLKRGTKFDSAQRARIVAGSFSAAIRNKLTADTLDQSIIDAAIDSVV